MTPRSDFPIKTSSGEDTKEGLTDDDKEPWKPKDDNPKVTITVTEEDKNVPIQTVTVSKDKTKNVKKVIVQVKDKDDKDVVRSIVTRCLELDKCSIFVL